MDGHRYADESQPSWYTGSQYARSADSEASGSHALKGGAYDSGVHERPSGAFRLPEQRPSAYPVADPLTTTGSHARPAESYESGGRVPVRGPEYPAVRPTTTPAAPAAVGEPTSLVPPVGVPSRAAENVYHTRRTASSFVVAIGMVVLMVPVVRLLLRATFTGTPSAATIVPSVLLTLGFALTGIGLFAVSGNRPLNRDAWLRPPVAYLPAGLILLVAAGLAVGG